MRSYASFIRWEEREEEEKEEKEEEEEEKEKTRKMAMFITCLSGSSLRKVQISSAKAFDDNDIL